MEVAERGMHRSLSGDVSREMANLESAVQREVQNFLCQIGKGGGYEILRRMREWINEVIMVISIKARLISLNQINT